MPRRFEDFTGVKLEFNWIGTSRTFSDDKIQHIANIYSAEHKLLSLRKKIIPDVNVFSDLNSIKTKIRNYWINMTLPYIERGVRLLPIDHIERFDQQMTEYKEELARLAQIFFDNLPSIIQLAKEQLGELFDENEYDIDRDCFTVEWKYITLAIPDYLRSHIEIYQREQKYLDKRINEVIALAKASFLTELQELTSHLIERLTPEDGKVKRLRREVIENFHEFFERFLRLNISDDKQLNDVINAAKAIIGPVNADDLRSDARFAERIRNELSKVNQKVENILNQPDMVSVIRRRIL